MNAKANIYENRIEITLALPEDVVEISGAEIEDGKATFTFSPQPPAKIDASDPENHVNVVDKDGVPVPDRSQKKWVDDCAKVAAELVQAAAAAGARPKSRTVTVEL